jgi:hypothetical protein
LFLNFLGQLDLTFNKYDFVQAMLGVH